MPRKRKSALKSLIEEANKWKDRKSETSSPEETEDEQQVEDNEKKKRTIKKKKETQSPTKHRSQIEDEIDMPAPKKGMRWIIHNAPTNHYDKSSP
jgi:hypothetical protein